MTRKYRYVLDDEQGMCVNMYSEGADDENGEKIEWKYLVELQKIQREVGLCLGNKLTKQHIQFHNNKMFVKIAAQTLSKSTADALDLCKDKYPQFKGCEPTIKFLRIFDSLFDTLNSKSALSSDFKRPLREYTEKTYFELYKKSQEYIKNLKYEQILTNNNSISVEKINIVKSASKTRFIGFFIGMESFQNMYKTNIQNGSNGHT